MKDPITWLVVWGVLLGVGCGETKRDPKPADASVVCEPDDCSDDCPAGCEPDCVQDDSCDVTDPPSCDPGQLRCKGTRIIECDEAGQDFVPKGTNCADDAQVCVAGECVAPLCTPGLTGCHDNSVYLCSDDGMQEQVLEICSSVQHCRASPGTLAICASQQCLIGELLCDGNVLKTCDETGHIADHGEDCGDDICVDAECKPKVCKLGSEMCVDGEVLGCNELGTATVLIQSCQEWMLCQALGDGLACVARPCEPGAAACLDNARGTCAANGQSLASVTEDCAADGKICNPNVACATSAVDQMGAAIDAIVLNGGVLGNVIDVHSGRIVTKLEADVLLEAPLDLVWVIYDLTDVPYELGEKSITSHDDGGLLASGAMSYELVAGKRYFVGVGPVEGEARFHWVESPASRKLSFGTFVGGTTASDATPPQVRGTFPDMAYDVRITTELP